MALATHPLKGSCSTSPTVPSLWSRGSKLSHRVPAFRVVERKDRFVSLKCRSCSSIGASLSLGPKSKSFKISGFKDNQFDDSASGRVNSSKSLNNAVQISYLKHKSEESSAESSKVQNDVAAPLSPSVEATTRSLAMQNLFKSWLMLLRAPSQTQAADKILKKSALAETSESPHTSVKQKGEILKAVWCYILSLDATIRIPFLIFIPLYLAVNLVYGIEVSKELTPLWIIGPLVVAFNIKMFRALCGLYAFSFKQTVNVVKNLPVYYFLVHDYLFHGKLKEAMRMHILQPIADIRNMKYNEMTWRKMKDLQGWLVERYLDFIELVWPYYSRTIRVGSFVLGEILRGTIAEPLFPSGSSLEHLERIAKNEVISARDHLL
ncbi:hypothetical protein C2S53_008040 [Perilla frutescens var. hirtella]|uniref:Uncharacterized protein n=1 Tax=Perilla frutescens var. hirtella TaxID=608512 RepID=A0AAD4P4P6_PERFH|nr:hypothetical protein C2S53_008040 [Perilla frutescens var. hirtella]